MRIGVCVHSTEIRAVTVRDDGAIASHVVPLADEAGIGGFAQALEQLLDLERHDEAVTSVTFDVGAVLRRKAAGRTTFVRIAPRAPVDIVHEHPAEAVDGEDVDIVHIAGGHSNSGEELVPLDAEALVRWCSQAPRGSRYVITAVGSPINESHEVRAGQILLDHAHPGSVEYSHSFHSSSVAVRERTAAVNSSLIDSAEEIVGALHPVLGRAVPGARLYVTTNEGGCHPLARLAVMPVHSLFAEASSALVGAAALAACREGFVAVRRGEGTFMGQFVRTCPAVFPQFRTSSGAALATQVANLVEISPEGHGLPAAAVIVEETELGDDEAEPDRPVLRTALSLCALGAVVTPLADWAHRVVPGTSEGEVNASIIALESRVRARLVSFGAHDRRIDLLESGVEASSYDNSSTVTVRVRGVSLDPIALDRESVVDLVPARPPGRTSSREGRRSDHVPRL